MPGTPLTLLGLDPRGCPTPPKSRAVARAPRQRSMYCRNVKYAVLCASLHSIPSHKINSPRMNLNTSPHPVLFSFRSTIACSTIVANISSPLTDDIE